MRNYQRFFLVNSNVKRTLYPRAASNAQDQPWQSPFKFEIELSQEAYVVESLKTFKLADLLIALGGISRSFYIFGLVCSHFVAKMLYRKALIEDMFMFQKPPKDDPFKLESDTVDPEVSVNPATQT